MNLPLTQPWGGNFAHVVIILRDDFKVGPENKFPTHIIGCYTDEEGNYRASEIKEVREGNILGMIMPDSSHTPEIAVIKTGMSPGDDPVYAAWIDGEAYLIDITVKQENEWYNICEGTVLDQKIEVLNNLYYTLPIKWITNPRNVIDGVPPEGYKLDLGFVRPKYRMGVETHEVIVGTGKLVKSDTKPHYIFSEEDRKRGIVTIQVNAVPNPDAEDPQASKKYSWVFEPYVEQTPEAKTEAEWRTLVYRNIDLAYEDEKLHVVAKEPFLPEYKVFIKYYNRFAGTNEKYFIGTSEDGSFDKSLALPGIILDNITHAKQTNSNYMVKVEVISTDESLYHSFYHYNTVYLNREISKFEIVNYLVEGEEILTTDKINIVNIDAGIALVNVTEEKINGLLKLKGKSITSFALDPQTSMIFNPDFISPEETEFNLIYRYKGVVERV